MEKNYSEITKRISGDLRKLRQDIPDTMKAFSALAQAATREGALDRKTKELIALAIGVATRCDGCIGFHTEALVKLGANSYLVCNNTAKSMAEIRTDSRWLKAQAAFVDLSEKFRVDPLVT